MEENLIYSAEKLIKDRHNNVIVTVAPFHLARIISEIIQKYPKLISLLILETHG